MRWLTMQLLRTPMLGKLLSTPTPTQAIFEQDLDGRLNYNFVSQNRVLVPVFLNKLDF